MIILYNILSTRGYKKVLVIISEKVVVKFSKTFGLKSKNTKNAYTFRIMIATMYAV